MTNREFAEKDGDFRTACENATKPGDRTIPPTMRQASKYRRGFGMARGQARSGGKL